ncbi:hypothetical protein L6452_27806 [Arctium lappa]|uniref:Uncharacterized protein n=1 Tax=Arctium lappa TaxID=4217 RepID=A0ACB8ZWL9_ARCLA|nr:hypothetical protein L6452_27806 [Arctium lappa]
MGWDGIGSGGGLINFPFRSNGSVEERKLDEKFELYYYYYYYYTENKKEALLWFHTYMSFHFLHVSIFFFAAGSKASPSNVVIMTCILIHFCN